jgi:hypothetical protein
MRRNQVPHRFRKNSFLDKKMTLDIAYIPLFLHNKNTRRAGHRRNDDARCRGRAAGPFCTRLPATMNHSPASNRLIANSMESFHNETVRFCGNVFALPSGGRGGFRTQSPSHDRARAGGESQGAIEDGIQHHAATPH